MALLKLSKLARPLKDYSRVREHNPGTEVEESVTGFDAITSMHS